MLTGYLSYPPCSCNGTAALRRVRDGYATVVSAPPPIRRHRAILRSRDDPGLCRRRKKSRNVADFADLVAIEKHHSQDVRIDFPRATARAQSRVLGNPLGACRSFANAG